MGRNASGQIGRRIQELGRSEGAAPAAPFADRAAREFHTLEGSDAPRLPAPAFTGGGTEHFVGYDETRARLLKYTKTVEGGGFGYFPGWRWALGKHDQKWRPEVILRFGTPGEYLQRWKLFNELFGDDVRFEGTARQTDGSPSMVVSQRALKGRHATPKEVAEEMRRLGFLRIMDSSPQGEVPSFNWYRAADNVVAADARPANFIVDDAGHVWPIDVVPAKLADGELLAKVTDRPDEGLS